MLRTTTCLAALTALIVPGALAETKTFDAQVFSDMKVRGAMTVFYEHGDRPSIRVEQAEGDFSDVSLEFEGGTLIVSRKSVDDRSGWFGGRSINISDNGKVIKVNGKRVPYYIVRVTGPDLDGARVSSSSRLTASGIQGSDFSGKVSSSGILTLSGTVDHAKLAASSSGDLNAEGLSAGTVDIASSSSGDVSAQSTGTGANRIDASSSGEVDLHSLGEADFNVDASSSADVSLSGACAEIEVSASSSADVEAEKLACRAADVSASSSGDVHVYASDSVTARASSGGDIYVSGNPTTRDVSRSSGGDIDFSS